MLITFKNQILNLFFLSYIFGSNINCMNAADVPDYDKLMQNISIFTRVSPQSFVAFNILFNGKPHQEVLDYIYGLLSLVPLKIFANGSMLQVNNGNKSIAYDDFVREKTGIIGMILNSVISNTNNADLRDGNSADSNAKNGLLRQIIDTNILYIKNDFAAPYLGSLSLILNKTTSENIDEILFDNDLLFEAKNYLLLKNIFEMLFAKINKTKGCLIKYLNKAVHAENALLIGDILRLIENGSLAFDHWNDFSALWNYLDYNKVKSNKALLLELTGKFNNAPKISVFTKENILNALDGKILVKDNLPTLFAKVLVKKIASDPKAALLMPIIKQKCLQALQFPADIATSQDDHASKFLSELGIAPDDVVSVTQAPIKLKEELDTIKKAQNLMSSILKISGKLNNIEHKNNFTILSCSSNNTAFQVSKDINYVAYRGLRGSPMGNKVEIRFTDGLFEDAELLKFKTLLENLNRLFFVPQIATTKPSTPISSPINEEVYERAHMDNPVKRIKAPVKVKTGAKNWETESRQDKQNNKNKVKGKAQKKKAPKNNSGTSEKRPVIASTPKPEKHYNLTEIWPSEYQLSTNKMPMSSRAFNFDEEVSELKPSQPDNLPAYPKQLAVQLLHFASNKITNAFSVFETKKNLQSLFFALYGPMLILCDVLGKNKDILDLGLSDERCRMFKALRDNELKIIGYYHDNESVIIAFSDFVKTLNNELSIAIPIMQKQCEDDSTTQTFSLNWDTLISKKDCLRSHLNLDEIALVGVNDGIKNLKQIFFGMGENADEEEGMGLIAMMGALVSSGTNLSNFLGHARDLRVIFAHHEMAIPSEFLIEKKPLSVEELEKRLKEKYGYFRNLLKQSELTKKFGNLGLD